MLDLVAALGTDFKSDLLLMLWRRLALLSASDGTTLAWKPLKVEQCHKNAETQNNPTPPNLTAPCNGYT
eukprot:5736675-Amphidinium_carterae.1